MSPPLATLHAVARRIALDIGLWYLAPAIFMAIYVFGFSLPSQSIGPHFLIIALPLAALALARLALARLIPNDNLALWIAATLCSITTLGLVTYYCLVIGGLGSWGGVISWNVIQSYAAQAPAYARTLGVSPIIGGVVAGSILVGLILLLRHYLRRFDWPRTIAPSLSLRSVLVLVVCGCTILGTLVYKFYVNPWTQYSEPVSLTFFESPSTRDVQGHRLDPLTAVTLDRREDQARDAYPSATHGSRRNLVLIVIDAQRPDHMGIYGYARDTTPNLSRLAQTQPVRKVEFVHSSCPDTACGLLSLSSSKFPRQFSLRPFTLQQVVRRNGYRVHMILGGDHSRFYGLRDFYGEVDTFYDGIQASGYFMNDDQLVLDRFSDMPPWDGTPTMFQFHLMSTHMLGAHAQEDARFEPAASYVSQFRGPDIGARSKQDESATNYYDNGVLKSDRMIHALMGMLADKGYLANTLVVITADHGEGLGEHGLFVHMNSVREEVLRIPLLMIAYGYEPERPLLARRVPAQVDVAPTILSELGLPIPGTWSGRALQEPGGADFIHFESNRDFGLIDLRDPERAWKYWANAQTGAEYAFDLSSDPLEMHDLLAQAPESLRREWRIRVLPGTPLEF